MRILAIISAAFIISGCVYTGQVPPSVCDQPEAVGSIICAVSSETGVRAEDIDLLLQIAAIRALDEDDKEVVLKFYTDAEIALRTTESWRSLVEYVRKYVDLTDPEILIISAYLDRFERPEIISAYDRGLLLIHIEHVKAIL